MEGMFLTSNVPDANFEFLITKLPSEHQIWQSMIFLKLEGFS